MGNGLLIFVSGPSGSGKGTTCDALLKEEPSLSKSVSCTTRKRRIGEAEGVNYFFKAKRNLHELLKQGDFLEFANVYSKLLWYAKKLCRKDAQGRQDVLLEIDVQGAMNVKKMFPDGVYLFFLYALNERTGAQNPEPRHRNRAADTDKAQQAAGEMNKMDEYDYIILSDKVDEVVYSIRCIIEAEKLKTFRNIERFKIFKGR